MTVALPDRCTRLRFLSGAMLACAAVFSPARACAAEPDQVLSDFEAADYGGWTAEGEAFGNGPAEGALPSQMACSGYEGQRLVNSFHGGDGPVGTLTSPEFVINRDFLAFLAGGGRLPGEVGIELLIDGQPRRTATGANSERVDWTSWDVRDLRGQAARLRLFDRASGGWGHILVDQVLLTDEPRVSTRAGRLEFYRKSPGYYRERWRPQLHFTPEVNWTNDPNGLVWLDGEFHLFYQHNPHGTEWGHMSWGHAVSSDLLHWKHLPIALHDEHGVMIFSGCCVFDALNTSGFGSRENPPLVAVYTGHGHDLQTQDLAYSLDRGRTWTKYSGNPVLDLSLAEFRDPKVFWHEPTAKWVMVVSLAPQKKLQFYGSPNLKDWTLLSEFGPAGVAGKPNWECPDLFELPVVGEPGATKWVLEADMGSGAVAGGSGGEYFIGAFDGTAFTPDSPDSQWVDFGRDFYAPVSWSNVPASDGRRLWIGWLNNWETSLLPTAPWRGGMSLPRELTLRRIDGRLRMCQAPVREIETLRGEPLVQRNMVLKETPVTLPLRGQVLEILAEFDPGDAREFGLRVCRGEEEQTVIAYDVAQEVLAVDRTKSGKVDFHPAFAGRHAGPLKPDASGRVRLRIIVDVGSVEVFGGQGETVLTDVIFPHPSSDRVELFAVGGDCTVTSLEAWALRSVWGAAPTGR